MHDAVGDDLEPLAEPAPGRLRRHRARPRSGRRSAPSGSPSSGTAELHPAEVSGRVPGGDDRAARERERATQIAGVIGSCTWTRSNRFSAQHVADAADRGAARGRCSAASRSPARRPSGPTGMIRPAAVAVPAGARMEQPRQPPRRVVAHHDLHLVPARAQRGGLVLGVLDDAAPVGPRERHDDPDLHA